MVLGLEFRRPTSKFRIWSRGIVWSMWSINARRLQTHAPILSVMRQGGRGTAATDRARRCSCSAASPGGLPADHQTSTGSGARLFSCATTATRRPARSSGTTSWSQNAPTRRRTSSRHSARGTVPCGRKAYAGSFPGKYSHPSSIGCGRTSTCGAHRARASRAAAPSTAPWPGAAGAGGAGGAGGGQRRGEQHVRAALLRRRAASGTARARRGAPRCARAGRSPPRTGQAPPAWSGRPAACSTPQPDMGAAEHGPNVLLLAY